MKNQTDQSSTELDHRWICFQAISKIDVNDLENMTK